MIKFKTIAVAILLLIFTSLCFAQDNPVIKLQSNQDLVSLDPDGLNSAEDFFDRWRDRKPNPPVVNPPEKPANPVIKRPNRPIRDKIGDIFDGSVIKQLKIVISILLYMVPVSLILWLVYKFPEKIAIFIRGLGDIWYEIINFNNLKK